MGRARAAVDDPRVLILSAVYFLIQMSVMA